MFYPIQPVAKPRMTRKDKWAKRPAVVKYHTFKDQCRGCGLSIPDHGAHIVFHMQIPESLPKIRRHNLNGTPHKKRPDADNLLKAVLDALFTEDAHIHDIRVSKVWALEPGIEVKTS